MRILLKVLLFPLALFLTLLVAFCRFFCLFSGMVLSIAAMVLFLLGLVLLFAVRHEISWGFWCWHGWSAPTACPWRQAG